MESGGEATAARQWPARWSDLVRAAIELARARLRLRSDHSALLRRPPAAPGAAPPLLDAGQQRTLDAVAFAIPRVAKRLPWRADCLVQALAAEHWLAAHAIPSVVVIGAKKAAGASMIEAHAWLEVGDRVVTGGEVAAFSRFSR